MVCSSSSPQQLRWTQVKLPHSRASSELGLDSNGLQKWAMFNCPRAEPTKPSREAGMEQLKLPQAPAWAWPCHRARAERGFEHLVTTQQSNCCYCTGSAFDQFYCLKPTPLWQTLNIPRAGAALASPEMLHNSTVTHTERDVPAPAFLHPKTIAKDAPSKECTEKGRGTIQNGIISPVHSAMSRTAPCSAVHWGGLEDQNVQIPPMALLGCHSRHHSLVFTVSVFTAHIHSYLIHSYTILPSDFPQYSLDLWM